MFYNKPRSVQFIYYTVTGVLPYVSYLIILSIIEQVLGPGLEILFTAKVTDNQLLTFQKSSLV